MCNHRFGLVNGACATYGNLGFKWSRNLCVPVNSMGFKFTLGKPDLQQHKSKCLLISKWQIRGNFVGC